MKIVLGRDDLAAATGAAIIAAGDTFERLELDPVSAASRTIADEGHVEVCEMPVMTLLQAVADDRPLVLLPITTLGRYQHQALVTLGGHSVADLGGRTVGVRSWSQTTGVWVRGILAEQYGVDLTGLRWRTYEDGHVDGRADPDGVTRAAAGAELLEDFLDRHVDLAIVANGLPVDDRLATVIPDARERGEQWSLDKGFAPVDHVVAVSPAAAREHPKAVLAAFDALQKAAAATGPAPLPVDLNPVGFAALRAPMGQAATYAYQQSVVPRAVDFDELVDRTCDALGVRPERLGG